ncbi:MAG: transposase [Bacteroidota bacterium]
MSLFQGKYRVESTRLPGYDYSGDGYYFVTICVKDRGFYLGFVRDGNMYLNEYGMIVQQCWFDLPNHYTNLRLDEFVVMPNHIHGIMVIDNAGTGGDNTHTDRDNGQVETGFKPVSTVDSPHHVARNAPDSPNHVARNAPDSHTPIPGNHGLFEFVRALKTFSSRQINSVRGTKGRAVWQSRFYDRIIRDEEALQRVRSYIRNNPKAWSHDHP